jgi:hypothetical protein
MARVLSSATVLRKQWPVPALAGQVVAQRGIIALDATALVTTDVLEAVVLPRGCVPLDFQYTSDDLDSGTALTMKAGFISGVPGDSTFANRSTVGAQILADGAFAQAAVVPTRVALTTFLRQVPQHVDRAIGFQVGTAPGTAVVRNGTLTVNKGVWKPGVAYVANDYLILPNGVIMECTTGGTSGVYGQTETLAPTQQGPAWNMVFAGTTTDGGVTWTCRSPVLTATLWYAQGLDKL